MRMFIVVCLLFVATAAEAQFKVPAGTPVGYAWDYTLAGISNSGVTKWECQVDTNPVVNTGLPVNATTYLFPLPLNQLGIGLHTVQCRAVGVVGPGNWMPLQIEITGVIPPNLLNPRFVPSTQPVSVNKGLMILDAMAELGLGRDLTNNELQLLIMTYQAEHPGERIEDLTRGKVIDHFEKKYTELVGGPR